MMKKKVAVYAPASVANLGCGFDSMGLAIDNPGDVLFLERNKSGELRIKKISGDGGKLSLDPLKNTATVAIRAMLDKLAADAGFDITLIKKMPLGSGLGSSAASAVAGAFALNELLGKPFSRKELVPFAMIGEQLASGSMHADNVGPSLLGGIILVRSYDPFEVISLPVPDKLIVVVVHPDVEVLTKEAREILPNRITMKDAVAQWSNTAALVSGLYSSDYALIGRAVNDRVAEPFRSQLIPGFDEVKFAALSNGALACSISGSGPALFAFADKKKDADKIAKAMQKEFRKLNIKSTAYISRVNNKGVKVI